MGKQRWGCIYRLTNKVNGKYYIGKTVNFKHRMNGHKNSVKRGKHYLCNAIRKYGWENFKQEILIDNVPAEDLNNLEISYIDIFDAINHKKGYNLTKGGEGTTGLIITDEHKKKIRIAKKKHSAEKGCICFEKRLKKWVAKSAHPQKTIGRYNTKEKAIQALELFNTTGAKMLSDITRRRKGTGAIYLTKENTYKTHFKTIYLGSFKTKELAEEAIKQYINNIN